MRKPRDYQQEIPLLEQALDYAQRCGGFLNATQARQSRRKLQSLKKSLQGAINNARSHANEEARRAASAS